MKKICKLLTVVCLSLLTVFSAVSCNEQPTQPSEEPTVQYTDTYLIKNGVSPYKIVLPSNATARLEFAAQELQYFFSLSTGVQLPIISDAEVQNQEGRYLSLGGTAIAADAGVAPTYEEVNGDGYRIKTHGDAVVMIGNSDDGTVYSVYGFLEKQFNLKLYTPDYYTYDTVTEAFLIDFDWLNVPDFSWRCGGTYVSGSQPPATPSTHERQLSRTRMRYMYGDGWGSYGHAHFGLLPPSKYYAEHPDWYYIPGNPENGRPEDCMQLAWANNETGMWDEFVKNLKQDILNKPDQNRFHLGHEDNSYYPDTGNYQEVAQANGGFASAVELIFLNYVVREINEWAAVEIPDRKLEFSMFAYGATLEPPVKKDENGNYVPFNENCVAEPNLGVMVTPIMMNTSHGYLDPSNEESARAFEGWAACTDIMHVWAYSAFFADYMQPVHGFGSYKRNYMDYKRLGVTSVFEQGIGEGYVPNFIELKQYLVSNLMWDCSLDTDDLIVEFMQVWYGAGWEYVYDYYTLMRSHMTELELQGVYAHVQDHTFNDPKLMPKAYLDQCDALFAKALSEAKAAGDERGYFNIEAERLQVWYFLLELYDAYYSPEEYRSLIDEYARIAQEHNFLAHNEGMGGMLTVDDIARWQGKLA